ncbi:protease FtsH subunit HflC [Novosphingobium sp. PhB165]|uniref:protease modulator HflC n=1 Tax=Novosphingobium sp. PhB165 TaxID=2485105 RepID=UPI00104D4721|nr:protease modulator HflC [Novosphingobium sp. PhB165]TCM17851.1 protease FtsH subunit HflC [Novosphingobium sp. PhB165]
MNSIWQDYKPAWIALGAVVIGAMLSVIVVPETEQVVIVRSGSPDRVFNAYVPGAPFGATDAGIHWRIPVFERAVRIDKRLLSVDMQQEQVLSTDQLRLNVDAFARFRIIDPVKMVQTAGTTEGVTEQLQPILSSVVRQELGKRTFESLLTAERGEAMAHIRDGLDREAREYGAQVVDVQIKRADLPEGALESAFARMQAARQEEAKTITAQGQKDAQIIRADAEAQAARIYADAFGKDPKFYDFYRAMQSYSISFAKGEAGKTILLSPDNAYLQHFREP